MVGKGRFTARATVKKSLSAKMPAFIPPQLATLSASLPKGSAWVHEIKFDGYRMHTYINKGKVQIISRNGKDWTEAFQPVADMLAKWDVKSAIIDGEMVVLDAHGHSNFSRMKDALSAGDTSQFRYYLFDLLYINGKNIMGLPLLKRKEMLSALMKGQSKSSGKSSQRILYSEHFTDRGNILFKNACDLQLEGVISKIADAPYSSGRSKSWLKTKCTKRQELVIGGYTRPSNGNMGIGALILGYYDDGIFVHAGRVGTGFTASDSITLHKKLERLKQENPAFASIAPAEKRGAIWVKPKLVGEVQFAEWTPDGHLRHASFQGLRQDKAAKDVTRDIATTPL